MGNGFILYHVTSEWTATEILHGGFRDGDGYQMIPGSRLKGVYLSNRALLGPFPRGVALEVRFSIPLDRLDEFEMFEDNLEYREWCIPEYIIKRWATVRLAETVERDDFIDARLDPTLEIARLRAVKIDMEGKASIYGHLDGLDVFRQNTLLESEPWTP